MIPENMGAPPLKNQNFIMHELCWFSALAEPTVAPWRLPSSSQKSPQQGGLF
jgi:hypothetical protein